MAYFEYQGKNVYYETHGEGKPLILLNGIMMSTKSWGIFKEAFSANNRLILLDFLDHKPEKLEVILTGQGPSEALIERADYVSELKKIKHPFDKGLAARDGIER